jgi:hypothetical protein
MYECNPVKLHHLPNMDMVTLYLCVTFQAFAAMVGVTPPPVSMISTCCFVSCVIPRRIGSFVTIVVCCNVLSKRWRLMDDWRKQDWCVANGLFSNLGPPHYVKCQTP